MRNWLLAWTVALPVSLCAQAIVTVPPEQCVYKVGDDPHWAAADLDESGWKPETQYQLAGDMMVLWVRCHANANLAEAQQPAVEIVAHKSAVQAFVDGKPIGGIAELTAGYISDEAVEKRVLPLPPDLARPVRSIAVRVAQSRLPAGSSPERVVAHIFLGDRESLVNSLARSIAERLWAFVPVYSCFLVIGAAGLFLFGLFLFDRSQRPALWLGLYCCCVSLVRVDSICEAHVPQIPLWVSEIVWAVNNFEVYALVLVIFALVNRRVPRIYWILLATIIVVDIGTIAAILLPPHWALPVSLFVQVTCFKPMWSIFAFAGTAPFVAFWPWAEVRGRMRIVAPVCALWALLEAAFYLGQVIFGRQFWTGGPVQTYWSISIMIVVVAMVAYIFQDQRATADERAQLHGELTAARKVQRTLMPEKLDVAPGMALSAAFLPASEVGGDFYRCRTLKDGSQRVVLGDVSGKGVAAALTSALLLGAADRCDDLPPASVLNVLNLALRQSAIGGFTTCLCADVSPEGSMRIANAGHLSPYRNGEEVLLSSGLPLGIVDDIDYPQTPLHLAPGDRLTFLSDGVVEARNDRRELFGFERARQMSTLTAQQLAEAARLFGQEDDITVLTLTLPRAAAPA